MERTVAPFYKGWRPAAAPSGAEPLEPGAEATPFTGLGEIDLWSGLSRIAP